MSSQLFAKLEAQSLPFSTDPGWSDVQPIAAQDGDLVVNIQYTQEHAEALSYFRAILAKQEKSERALQLTADIIKYNQADYTAWAYRWECLSSLNKDLEDELTFTESIMQDNAKNYQLWNHRRKIATARGCEYAEEELLAAKAALDRDEKNYHAWAHRQTIVLACGAHLWQLELDYVSEMIERDVRNNSAWNQRLFIMQHDSTQLVELQQVKDELIYVAEQVAKAPRNESVWNYLRGLFTLPASKATYNKRLGEFPEIYTICTEALKDCSSCTPALELLADFYTSQAVVATEGLATSPKQTDAVNVTQALASADYLLALLFTTDPIRSMYWKHKKQQLTNLKDVIAPLLASLPTSPGVSSDESLV